jgi:hypothetical protein
MNDITDNEGAIEAGDATIHNDLEEAGNSAAANISLCGKPLAVRVQTEISIAVVRRCMAITAQAQREQAPSGLERICRQVIRKLKLRLHWLRRRGE